MDIMGMFAMAGNYEDRKVGNDTVNNIWFSTAMVTDGAHPYETAIEHPDYNNGEIIIVEAYDSKDDAKKGHAAWMERASSDKIPDPLIDRDNSGLAGTTVFPKQK